MQERLVKCLFAVALELLYDANALSCSAYAAGRSRKDAEVWKADRYREICELNVVVRDRNKTQGSKEEYGYHRFHGRPCHPRNYDIQMQQEQRSWAVREGALKGCAKSIIRFPTAGFEPSTPRSSKMAKVILEPAMGGVTRTSAGSWYRKLILTAL